MKTFSFVTFISFLLDTFLHSEPKLYVIVAVFKDIEVIHQNVGNYCFVLLMNSAVRNFVILQILIHFKMPL